jgi:hypothetical protein
MWGLLLYKYIRTSQPRFASPRRKPSLWGYTVKRPVGRFKHTVPVRFGGMASLSSKRMITPVSREHGHGNHSRVAQSHTAAKAYVARKTQEPTSDVRRKPIRSTHAKQPHTETMNANSNHVRRENRGEKIARSDVSEGDTVVFDWSPYDWWNRETGVSGRVKARVTDVCDISGDIVIRVLDGSEVIHSDGTVSHGEVLRDYGEGRRYVSGRADFCDGVPDRTDVGMGGRYYKVDK